MVTSIQSKLQQIIENIVDGYARQSPRKCIINPCGTCSKSISKSQKLIKCTVCQKDHHIKCNDLSDNDIVVIQKKKSEWKCIICVLTYNLKHIPFTSLQNSEIVNLNQSDTMKFLETFPPNNIINVTDEISSIKPTDINELPSNSSSKYYSNDQVKKVKLDRKFNIFHSNLNGLESKLDNLQQFIASLNNKLDIITLSETSEQEDTGFIGNIEIEGYKLEHHSPTKTSKGGTAIYVDNRMNTLKRDDLTASSKEFESSWIEIKNKKSRNIIVGCIYRHPHNNFTEFFEFLEQCLIKISKENKEIYVSGDFNFDLLHMESNPDTQSFHNLFSSYGLLPHITQPTRVTISTATIIDNIFSNNIQNKIEAGNILVNLSDHFPQFISVDRDKPDYKEINIYQRDYKNFSTQSFRDDISIQRWDCTSNNVHNSFHDFFFRLEGVVDRHAPMRKLTPKEVETKQKPWINKTITNLIKERDRARARKLRQPNNAYWNHKYNILRNEVNRKIRKSKKDYHAKYFENHKNNSKKVWEGIRNIVNLKKVSSKTVQLKVDGKIIEGDIELATKFNEFFVNVGPNTESSIPKVPNISPTKYMSNRINTNFVIAHISNEEIIQIINSLPNKSSGPSSIPLKLLSIIPDLIIFPLAHIINLSFQTGEFPNLLKLVKVIPIHKGGSSQEVNNYRPISLLSIFDKLIEKIMHKHLYAFLESHQILYKNQFGFRKSYSTGYTLMKITESIKEAVDKQNYACGIFIDLRKAFDTVNHEILLMKLEYYGIRGNLLNWFRSYLTGRQQCVCINGTTSSYLDISCGVPQGSVLGPLLFLLYINDLPNISKILDFFLFADDTNIFYKSKSLATLQKKLNKELRKLYLWLNINRLSLNIDKTNFIVFHPYNKPIHERITLLINKKAIKETNFIKYLGVLVDSTLSWNYHINNITKKVSRAIGVMYKLRPYLPLEIMKNIYYSLIYSHINYGIEAWGYAFQIYLNKLEVLQKRALRLMTFNDKFPDIPGPLIDTNPIFKELKLLKIKDIFYLNINKFIHKCINKKAPSNFDDWFSINTNNYTTRSKVNFSKNSKLISNTEWDKTNTNNLYIPHGRTVHMGLNQIKVSGPRFWNILPTSTKTQTSISIFIKDLKEFYLSQY